MIQSIKITFLSYQLMKNFIMRTNFQLFQFILCFYFL